MRVDRDIKRLSQSGILESFRLSVFFVQNWQKISQKEKYFHFVLVPFIVVFYCQLHRLILLCCYFKDIIFFTKGRLTNWFSKGFKSLRTPLFIYEFTFFFETLLFTIFSNWKLIIFNGLYHIVPHVFRMHYLYEETETLRTCNNNYTLSCFRGFSEKRSYLFAWDFCASETSKIVQACRK